MFPSLKAKSRNSSNSASNFYLRSAPFIHYQYKPSINNKHKQFIKNGVLLHLFRKEKQTDGKAYDGEKRHREDGQLGQEAKRWN